MAVDPQQMNPPSTGGFFSNKRNLLFLALALGGGIGLIMFLMRRSQPTVTPENQANAMTQTDLQLGNIAQQLLQFRGESSKAAANLQTSVDQGNQTLSGFQTDITSLLTKGFGDQRDLNAVYYRDILGQLGIINQNVYEGIDEQRTGFARLTDIGNQGIAQGNDNFTRLRDLAYAGVYGTAQLPAQPSPRRQGAGGFSTGDWARINWTDAGDGMGGQWYPLVSGMTPRRV